jgi:hypothetical protein
VTAKSSNTGYTKPKPTSTKVSAIQSKKSEEPIVFKFTDDSAEDLIRELVPDIAKSFGDSAWKVRLNGGFYK